MKNKSLLQFVWKNVIVVLLYSLSMWGLLVVAALLYLEDFWKSAGIISALILFRIVQSEFYREFYGARNPEVEKNAVQKQSKR